MTRVTLAQAQQLVGQWFAFYQPPEYVEVVSWRLGGTTTQNAYRLRVIICDREARGEGVLALVRRDLAQMAFLLTLVKSVMLELDLSCVNEEIA